MCPCYRVSSVPCRRVRDLILYCLCSVGNVILCYLLCSVGNCVLQGTTRDGVHVRGAGHPRHERATQAAVRLAASQVHQGDQGAEDRDHALWHDEAQVPSL